MTKNIDALNELFDELVPPYGKANTLAGEVVRALSRIAYRYYNDGDRIAVDYGCETCTPAARFLIEKLPSSLLPFLTVLWGSRDTDEWYEKKLDILIEKVLDFLKTTDWKNIPNEDDCLTCFR